MSSAAPAQKVSGARTIVEFRRRDAQSNRKNAQEVGVPYGNRTRVAAVIEKRPILIQRVLAAWIALDALDKLTGTLIGPLMDARDVRAARGARGD